MSFKMGSDDMYSQIIESCKDGNIRNLAIALSKVNNIDGALMYAAQFNNVKVLNYLVKKHNPHSFYQAFLVACQHGSFESADIISKQLAVGEIEMGAITACRFGKYNIADYFQQFHSTTTTETIKLWKSKNETICEIAPEVIEMENKMISEVDKNTENNENTMGTDEFPDFEYVSQ